MVKSPISRTKARYEVALRGAIPCGVSSHHVLVRAFGDAHHRRENVRHATLLFCAEGVNVRTTGAGEASTHEKRHQEESQQEVGLFA